MGDLSGTRYSPLKIIHEPYLTLTLAVHTVSVHARCSVRSPTLAIRRAWLPLNTFGSLGLHQRSWRIKLLPGPCGPPAAMNVLPRASRQTQAAPVHGAQSAPD